MKPQKIHIIGGSGSGKSYLSQLLSDRLDIPCHDLDDIFWDSSADRYDVKTDPEKRQQLLMEILSEQRWIIEGVYYRWLEESFRRADIIIILKTNVYLRHWRICRRFFKRKLGLMAAKKKESLREMLDLIRWNHRYDKGHLREAEQLLKRYEDKILVIRSRREAALFIKSCT